MLLYCEYAVLVEHWNVLANESIPNRATAVSGMHWVATVGTNYRLKYMPGKTGTGLSRQATAIVVICLVGSIFASEIQLITYSNVVDRRLSGTFYLCSRWAEI